MTPETLVVVISLAHAWDRQGYVPTRSGAEGLARHCRLVRRPVDIELDHAWDHGVPRLAVFPVLLTDTSTASTIGTARWTRPEVPAGLHSSHQRTRVDERAQRIARWMRVMGSLRCPPSGLKSR